MKKIIKLIGISSFCILIVLFLLTASLFLISHSSFGLSESDKYFMAQVYKEAELALDSGDVPVGAILVVNDSILAKAHNTVELNNDTRNHAEMLVINEALQILNICDFSHIKDGVTLYTTYEPCPMCEGFIVWKKVPRVVVGKRKNILKLIRENYLAHVFYRLRERGGVDEEKQHGLFKQHRQMLR